MNSKKESVRKVKQNEREKAKNGEKVEKLKAKLSAERKEKKYLKRRLKETQASRDRWKEKHKSKQQEVKALKGKIKRDEKIERHHYPKLLIVLCVLLRIKGGCSYGGIIRVLKVIRFCFQLDLPRLPCENSVQNWVSKVGLYSLDKEDKGLRNKQVSLIVDESIRMGQEKQLLVLCVPYKKEKEGALIFEDVDVLHVQGAKSWTGEQINEVLKNLEEKYGFEAKNILSDEDSKLKKASRLSEIVHLPDISHAVATCLRRSFEKAPEFKAFTTLVASYQSKGVNQDISYLCPPKQRTKARFMNLHGIVNWGDKVLERFDLLGEKAKGFFSQLSEHQPIINNLRCCLDIAKKISLPMKENGLSSQTLRDARKITQTNANEQELTGEFLVHINGYLAKYQGIVGQIGNSAINVSSEIIESLFGKYKSKAHNHPLTGVTKLNLELPLYCMKEEELVQKIPIALQEVSMNHLEQWIEKHSPDSQLVKRIRFFNK